MPRARTTHVLLASVILVGGANAAAYAATGDPLLGGKSNSTERTTTLENTGPGPVLKLKGGAGAAPLAVSSSKRVPNLNADRIDGLDTKDLQTPVYRYEVSADYARSRAITFPDLPAGIYQASYSLFSRGVANTARINCYLRADRVRAWSASTFTGPDAYFFANNASAIVDTRETAVQLECSAPGDFAIQSVPEDVTSEVSFTRVDTLTDSTAVVAGQP